jgi:hypothetical protein
MKPQQRECMQRSGAYIEPSETMDYERVVALLQCVYFLWSAIRDDC